VVGKPFAAVWHGWPLVVDAMAKALQGELHDEVLSVGDEKVRLECSPRPDEDDRIVGAVLLTGPASPHDPVLGGRGLSILMRHLPLAIWATDTALRVTEVVGTIRGWRGPDRAHLIGATVPEILGSDDPADPLLRAHASALAGTARSLRYRFDGRSYDVDLRPLRAPGGEIVGCACVAIDVSERAESEARLTEIQRIAHVGSWEWDVTSNKVTWSDELYRVYGLGKDQFSGTYEGFLERVLPEDREHTRAVVFDAYRKAEAFTYDHRIVRPDGRVRMLHTSGGVVVDAHGKVLRLAGVCLDITERWEATQALQQNVSLLGATLESTTDGLLVIDRGGRVITFNRRLLELWGISREVVEGKTFQELLDLTHPLLENAEACLQSVREMQARPDAESFDSLHFRDGRYFERYSRPQRVGDEITGRVWSYRDITDRERLLREALFLSDASRLLASLDVEPALEAMARLALSFADAIAIDTIADSNPRRLLVLSRDPTRSIATELPPVARAGQPALYFVGSSSYMTVPLRTRGAVSGMLTLVAPSQQPFVPGDLSHVIELGRRVELAMENAYLYRETREALAARDEFLSVAAHELRGPLTSMRLAVDSLEQNPNGPSAPRMLSIIEHEDQRLADLSDELLDVVLIRGGQLRFLFAPVDLVEVTRAVVSRSSPELTRSGSSLSITAPPSVVGTWDRARVEQIVNNLLGNAIKFGLGKPITIKIDSDGVTATLTVTDHGLGISDEAQRRIFAPFERAVSARHYGGLGLGLFIVKTNASGLAGTIDLASKVGEGSTFTVRLPLARSAS
jgi:PAS domain S-box-containing protein